MVYQRIRVPVWVLLLIATAFGLSSTAQAYFLERLSRGMGVGEAGTIGQLLALNLVYWYVPALLAPSIMSLALRFPLARVRWPVQIAVHVPGALAYSVLHTAAMVATRITLSFVAGLPPLSTPWWQAVGREYLRQLDWLLMTYLFLVGLAHALAYQRESEARALDTARLETALVRAQLTALQHQIRPHFLFNTLNTIAGLVHVNPEAADRMIAGLGDLLRVSLHASGIQEVPLDQELDVLEKYLDIEQTRLGNRLRVSMQIEAAARDALVPNLLLQPLVENAIRHGVAPHARPGWIAIRAEREGQDLLVQVRDSGKGLPPERLSALNNGVGLANTRARLAHLYPSAHQCLFSNLADGFSVTIHIPFRHAGDERASDQGAA
jgi:two-component system LytT family sensor kinase